MFIDTHCHLNFEEFASDWKTVIQHAQKVHVETYIVPGASYTSSHHAITLSHEHDAIFSSIGFHPYETLTYPSISQLEHMIDERVVAIGECGLDYHPYKGFPAIGKKEEQKQLFESQLLLAIKHKLPVIIHCRDAFMDIFDVLDSLPTMPKGVFHCFSGGLEDFRNIRDRGFYIGLDGNITFSKHLQTIIPSIPLSSILLETDAPWLTPIPYRGTRNEPKHIPLIAKTLASLLSLDDTIIEEQTTKNAKSVFHISQ